ncbi:hypothetical protein M446_5489 [Methylobacterium sp. 4-46]|uniref:hypothetical protein n=1 Tax=unclassified Methylobacterium TaxID=2615210 RepID=UPI000165CDD1|nr:MULTISPECIES: hypothetical protein [Methylobacterium]ACA19805.1 hypothetical protein M446_5489 [Methylobacterium sp. 4-46]WFT78990.1 hypothetical protein QA634_27650 [Methylobacterium nodulans]
MSDFGPVPPWARRRMQRVHERNPKGKIARWIAFAGPQRTQHLSEGRESGGSALQASNVIAFATRVTDAGTSNAAA